jgi:uncharacterized protein YeaC (DUF1315 family)
MKPAAPNLTGAVVCRDTEMKFEDIVNSLNPEQYASLKRAVELGKWPDGRVLAGEQRELSLQVLIAYDARHKPEEERIGYVHTEKKTECEHEHHEHADEVPIKILQ